MIRHVVLLVWNEKATEDGIRRVSEAFAALPSKIAEIQGYSFGPDLGIYEGNAGYIFIADFASAEDFKRYVSHPAHRSLMKDITGPILESFQAAQFRLP